AGTSKPPPRVRCADSRLSTSEYTACSGPRGLGFAAGSAGFAGLFASATLPALLAAGGGCGSETFPSGVVSLLLLPQAQQMTSNATTDRLIDETVSGDGIERNNAGALTGQFCLRRLARRGCTGCSGPRGQTPPARC